jgi:hypothetical protein
MNRTHDKPLNPRSLTCEIWLLQKMAAVAAAEGCASVAVILLESMISESSYRYQYLYCDKSLRESRSRSGAIMNTFYANVQNNAHVCTRDFCLRTVNFDASDQFTGMVLS